MFSVVLGFGPGVVINSSVVEQVHFTVAVFSESYHDKMV